MPPVVVCPKCKSEIETPDSLTSCPSCHSNFEQHVRTTITITEAPIELIHWDNRFAIGNKVIDEQHEKLCDLINELHRAIHAKTYRANFILDLVKSLIAYASNHFRTEESLFVGTTYPDTELHLKEHHFFEAKALAFRKEYTESQIDLKPVLRFLVEWFIRHVQSVDRGYKEFITK
jgi:hemerythrin